MQQQKKARAVKKLVRGVPTVDGAGVHLTRVLGNWTMYDFDPFLMLDSFDSTRPEDYVAGFPWHPHRGIETITYLISGEIEHGDSLGNKGTIRAGQSQWMCAGSGILHQEMPKATRRLLGVQLWLNLPQSDKMDQPEYFDITEEKIGVKRLEGATVRVVSGEFQGARGAEPQHIPARILDVALVPGKAIVLDTDPTHTAFAFLLEGDGTVAGERVGEKTAVLLTEGNSVRIASTRGAPLRVLLCSAPPLREEIAWGGPIVMNTSEELQQAFEDLDNGNFIKEAPRNAPEGVGQALDVTNDLGRPEMAGEDVEQPGLEASLGHEPEPPATLGDDVRLL